MKNNIYKKNKLTPEEMQKLRVRIANMVARDKTIDRRCCVCGKRNAEILHNQNNPYLIAFLCRTCRIDKNNIKKAKSCRFNLRKHKSKLTELTEDKTFLHTNQYTPETVRGITKRYLLKSYDKNFGEYCKEIGLSRYQFNSILELYKKYFPEDHIIIEQIQNKRKAIQRKRLSIRAKYRELNKITNKYNNSERK